MPTPTKGARLGGSPAHERLMLANLATSLFAHGRLTTTEAKARRMQPLAEKLITKAKRGDLHNRRQIQRVVRDKDVVHKLMDEIGPFFSDRNGGYTRITRTLPRKGDNASMAVIELVSEKTATAEAEAARKTKFAKDTAKKSTASKAEGAAEAGTTEVESAEADPKGDATSAASTDSVAGAASDEAEPTEGTDSATESESASDSVSKDSAGKDDASEDKS